MKRGMMQSYLIFKKCLSKKSWEKERQEMTDDKEEILFLQGNVPLRGYP